MKYTPSNEMIELIDSLPCISDEAKETLLKMVEVEAECHANECFIRMLEREQKRRSGINIHTQLRIE